jgi:signal transduction histidine kinase
LDPILVAVIGVALLGAVLGTAVYQILRIRNQRDAALRSTSARVARLVQRVAALEEGHRRRELILDAMGEGVLLVDGALKIRYRNPAATRLLGGSEELPPVLIKMAAEARSDGSPTRNEFDQGEPPRTLRAGVIPLGEDELVLVILSDVTEARLADVVRRDFVEAASHELKTPVTSIRAAAETLINAIGGDPDVARAFAEGLLKDSERLARIVGDLLDLSRLETEEARMEEVSLNRIADDEAERISDAALKAGVSLQVDAQTPVRVWGSGRDLALAVRNLLDNAVRYTPAGGKVHIKVEVLGGPDGGKAIVVVEDDGIGIPKRDLPRIFERFYRVDRARSRERGGTGLGLAIVKHVAERHSGRVEVVSELGQGSRFSIAVPMASPQDR